MKLLGVVRTVWREIHENPKFADTRIGIASRCDEPNWAMELLKMFVVCDRGTNENGVVHGVTMFQAAEPLIEIYRESKQVHFAELQKKTDIDFEDMLFFDDDPFNISDVSKLGVTCVLTPDGVTKTAWELGLHDFAMNKKQDK